MQDNQTDSENKQEAGLARHLRLVRLLPCPFCGDEVTMEYAPATSYDITCCVSMDLQICDALEDEGKRGDDAYRYDSEMQEYPERSKEICRRRLAEAWNKRSPLFPKNQPTPNMETDTPGTDIESFPDFERGGDVVLAEFARKMERERDEWRNAEAASNRCFVRASQQLLTLRECLEYIANAGISARHCEDEASKALALISLENA